MVLEILEFGKYIKTNLDVYISSNEDFTLIEYFQFFQKGLINHHVFLAILDI